MPVHDQVSPGWLQNEKNKYNLEICIHACKATKLPSFFKIAFFLFIIKYFVYEIIVMFEVVAIIF